LLCVAAATATRAAEPSFQHIEESLTCQCGCGLTVHSCNHLQCPSAIPLRQEIREQMALGVGEESILAHFANKYGEKILSSPTTTGFNLAAWVTPFIGVAIGTLIVSFTLLRWRRGTTDPAAAPRRPERREGVRAEHEKTLERELREFDQ
jgi:cytochrome c-type biogenesis protein CcmH/NrfF